MELFQLRYFLEAAHQQHIRKSAETLHVSQPAVTNAIHRLEAELGVPLFVPNGRSIRLSPYGKYLYDELLPLAGTLSSLPDRIRSLRAQGMVTIRLNVFAAWFIILDAILEFQRIAPDISFKFARTEGPQPPDISVFTTQQYRPQKRKENGPFVRTEEVFLAVPDIPRFQGRDSLQLKEVADMGFIQISESMHFRAICNSYCKAAGFYPNTIFESDDPNVIRYMICKGMGVGFWPEFARGKDFTDRILLKKIEKPECKRDIIIEKHDVSSDNIYVQVFYDYLTRYIDLYHHQLS